MPISWSELPDLTGSELSQESGHAREGESRPFLEAQPCPGARRSPFCRVPAGPIVLPVVMAVAVAPVAPTAETAHAVAKQ